jgi:outer membrane protein assembly factor BamA
VVFLIFLVVCSTQIFAQSSRGLPSSPPSQREQAGKAKPASHKSDEPDQTEQLAALSTEAASQDAAAPVQESRAAQIEARQVEKSKESHPRQTNKAEKWIRQFEGVLLEDSAGLSPAIGSVYHGGGVALGANYRKYFGDNTFWNVKALYSIRNYKLVEAKTESRDHLGKRLSFGSRLGWRDATQVGYYGLGTNTQQEARANFRFQETSLDGHAVFKPVRWVPLKASVAYEHFNTTQGQGLAPSIETRYTPQSTPGLGADPTYLHSQLSAGIDWRQAADYTRKGGLYQATFHDYRNNGRGIFSFQRLDGDLIQHVPLLRETWVLSMRGRVQTTLDDNDLVPYFLLPALGSGSTLRAFATDRFRDRHSLLMSAEFRWIPNPFGLDMALFYDAGKVTSRRRDLNFKGLKSDVGIGARFHGPFSTPLRLELAVGNEGWKVVFSANAAF